MAHHIATSQNPNTLGDIGRLTIVAPPSGFKYRAAGTLKVSRVRDGLRFATDGRAHVYGEDLYALREFLAELPEELFVRPADPVAKPRWVEGDLVRADVKNRDYVLYRRDLKEWEILGFRLEGGYIRTSGAITDEVMDSAMTNNPETYTVLRQANA